VIKYKRKRELWYFIFNGTTSSLWSQLERELWYWMS